MVERDEHEDPDGASVNGAGQDDPEPDEGAPRQARAAAIREEDIEPYTALRWVATLFKAGAIFLAVALVGEAVAGIKMGGSEAIPILLGELARTLVFIVVLWGAGDLVRLLIDLGHDIRAQRVLLARMAYRLREPPDEKTHVRSGHTPAGFPEPEEHEAAGERAPGERASPGERAAPEEQEAPAR